MSVSFLYWNFRTLLAWALACVAFVAFSIATPHFLNVGNFYALFQSMSVLLLVASGLGLVMIAGEFDLSIAGTLPLAALIAVKGSATFGVIPAIGVAVLAGVTFGVINGWITSAFRIPSLAVTVGSMVLAIGIGFAIAGGELVQSSDFTPGLLLTERIGGMFSLQSLIQLTLGVLLFIVVKRSWFGRNTYAIGSDVDRARNSGIAVKRTIIGCFVVSGAFTAVAGAFQGTALATGTAGANEPFLLQAATAAILGGVALTGGKGSLLGVFGASVLLAVIANGLSLLGADTATIQLVNGTMLLIVVIIDRPMDRVIEKHTSRQVLATA
jgi:ribose transport system permease protein